MSDYDLQISTFKNVYVMCNKGNSNKNKDRRLIIVNKVLLFKEKSKKRTNKKVTNLCMYMKLI